MKLRRWCGWCLGLLLALAGCRLVKVEPPASFPADKLAAMDGVITQAIAARQIPGGVLWVEQGQATYHRAYGARALEPAVEPATEDTLYDAASLTKVLATAPAILWLIERGRVRLEAPVHDYLPEFKGAGKEAITVRQLLTHTSGLRAGLSLDSAWSGHRAALALAGAETPADPPGTLFRYSDINFILLGEIVRRVSGLGLDEFSARKIYRPLRMRDTGFLPPLAKLERTAPTERVEGVLLRGIVHDPTARRLGGVAGHAGLFTTASDLARFARMLLNGGTLEGVRVFRPETVRLMTTVQTPPALAAQRGLGWDMDTDYSRPRGDLSPPGSYGHTGWTGTCLWIDPASKTFWIFLSNRNHPAGGGNVRELQRALGTLAAEAGLGDDFSPPPRTDRAVLNGIDVLVAEGFAPLRGLRVGLITNPTGHDQFRHPTIDLLRAAPGVQLKALFSPEHGLRADRDEPVADSRDPVTGLPVYSLFGDARRPKPEQLRELDALVFDIQDIGCRFYTYISTMGNALETAAQARLKFIVLDRVNPINGITIEGPVLTGPTGFTAFHPLPVRHAMTVGELARLFNADRGLKADLTVIPVRNWSRRQWFDQTGLPWTNPSPNMRSLAAAALYPGIGLLETTALSVGRGTDTPFEIIGAPYIDGAVLAAELGRAGLGGVRFLPVRFTPRASLFQGQTCGGVQIILTDRQHCPVLDVGLVIAQTLHRLYPGRFILDPFDRLLGHAATLDALKAGQSLAQIHQLWAADLRRFESRRQAVLLYR